MARFRPTSAAPIFILITLVAALTSRGAEPLERFLPTTTKGFISLPDIDRAMERWEQTQLGQLMAEPSMKPFVEEIRDKFQKDFLALSERFGVQVGQLRELRGGDCCLAFVQPQGAVTEHAAVLMMDVEGRERQAQRLLDAITEDLQTKGGERSSVTSQVGVSLLRVVLPSSENEKANESYMAVHRSRLLVTDRLDVANTILMLMDGAPNNLANTPAFQATMNAGGESDPDVRWFIEPFGLVEVLRASEIAKDQTNSIDVLEVLTNQGFRAIEGVGGHVRLATGSHEILHRTMVYAPGNQSGERFNLAARMLSFPNSKDMTPKPWVPADVTTHMTFRWDIRNAFEMSKSLVNEYAGEKVFEEIIRSIEVDENGPQINLRRDLVAHFSDRVTVVADHATPIKPDSERVAVAIELANEDAVRKAIDRAMTNDPNAVPLDIGGLRFWQMGAAEEEEEDEEVVVVIGDPYSDNPFGPSLDEDEEEECDEGETQENMMSKLCLVVAHGQLFASKKLDFLHRIVMKDPQAGRVYEQEDFATVRQALQQLGSNNDAARFFVRTDKAYEPTYEMLRTGQMPESKSMFGQMLNRIFGSEDSDRPRMQQLNGSTLPTFEQVRRFLGPAGMFIRSSDQGWIITGCLLRNGAGA